MCYADPGSRCFTHGKADYDQKEKAFTDATILAVRLGTPEAEKKAEIARNKMVEAETKMYASKDGLAVLKEKLDGQVKDGLISEKYANNEYMRVLNIHKKNMHEYDKINRTVNGRKPSKDWDSYSRKHYVNQIMDNRQKITELEQRESFHGENHSVEIDKIKEEQRLLLDRHRQAEDTYKHIKSGILTEAEAPKRAASPPKAKEKAPAKAKVATTKKNSPKQVDAYLPSEPKEKGYANFVGGRYDPKNTNQKVAAFTRADLKKAVATGALPTDYEYKVTNRKNTIEINIVGKHDKNIDSYEGAHGGTITRVSGDGQDLKGKVSAYASQYTYNKSNSQYDNFNQSHSVFVNFIDRDTGKDVRR